MTKIILLNGVGSAGKSSIAQALQEDLSDIYLHVQMDAFLDMLPDNRSNDPKTIMFIEGSQHGKPVTTIKTGPDGQRLFDGMRHAIAAMARAGNNLIIDDVLLGSNLQSYLELISEFKIYKIGVFAPLDVLEKREKERGDRIPGLARWQYGLVHRGIEYDMTVDTSTGSPKACAKKIIETLNV